MFLQIFSRGCFASDKIKRTDGRCDLFHIVFLLAQSKISLFFEKEALCPVYSLDGIQDFMCVISKGGCSFYKITEDYWLVTYGKKEQIMSAKDANRDVEVQGYKAYIVDILEMKICSCFVTELVRSSIEDQSKLRNLSDLFKDMQLVKSVQKVSAVKALEQIKSFIIDQSNDNELMISLKREMLANRSPYLLLMLKKDPISWIRISITGKVERYEVARPATSLWASNIHFLSEELDIIKKTIGVHQKGSTVVHIESVTREAIATLTKQSDKEMKKGKKGGSDDSNESTSEFLAKLICRYKVG